MINGVFYFSHGLYLSYPAMTGSESPNGYIWYPPNPDEECGRQMEFCKAGAMDKLVLSVNLRHGQIYFVHATQVY